MADGIGLAFRGGASVRVEEAASIDDPYQAVLLMKDGVKRQRTATFELTEREARVLGETLLSIAEEARRRRLPRGVDAEVTTRVDLAGEQQA